MANMIICLIIKTMKKAHTEFINNIFHSDPRNSAKRLWGYPKSFKMGRIGVLSLTWENMFITIAREKADVFAIQYKLAFTLEDGSTVPTKS